MVWQKAFTLSTVMIIFLIGKHHWKQEYQFPNDELYNIYMYNEGVLQRKDLTWKYVTYYQNDVKKHRW